MPSRLTDRERIRIRRPGKCDAGDALAIARIVLREQRLPPACKPPRAEELGVLVDYRDELVARRIAIANRLRADLTVLRPGYSTQLRALRLPANLDAAPRLLRGDHSVRAEVARDRVSQLRRLDRAIAEQRRRISDAVRVSGTRITQIHGVGDVVAARILAEVGDVRRYPSADHFASATGTAPIPASSGRTVRYRVNRGGNRRLNRALHVIALTQESREPRARAYLERKRAAGKTTREAIRCLKRHLSNVVYRALLADFEGGVDALAA